VNEKKIEINDEKNKTFKNENLDNNYKAGGFNPKKTESKKCLQKICLFLKETIFNENSVN